MAYSGPVFYKHTNAAGEWVYQAATEPQTPVITVHILDQSVGAVPPDRLDVVATVFAG